MAGAPAMEACSSSPVGEEAGRDRHHPLIAALALDDKHPPHAQAQIVESKSEHLAAAQPTQHHRRTKPVLRPVRRLPRILDPEEVAVLSGHASRSARRPVESHCDGALFVIGGRTR
jgi:hypothetical protein